MKQCPNPNCILYTRLEELPDAYVKCPGCGGMLVSVEHQSKRLGSSRPGLGSAGRRPSTGPLQPAQVDSGLLGPSQVPPTPPHLAADPLNPYNLPDPYDPYAPLQQGVPGDHYAAGYADTNPYASRSSMSHPQAQPAYASTSSLTTTNWTTGSKVAFGVGSVLLLVACGLLGWIFSNRFFPQARVIASPQATETALALVRPPVNTPIVQPSITIIAGNFSPPTIVIPTQPIQEPTPLPPAPTQVVVPPTQAVPQPPGPNPPAPPRQEQPTGGITEAHMESESGSPTSRYAPTEPFNLAVQATFGAGNVTTVLTRWYGPDGTQIYAMQKDYTQAGVYSVAFSVRKNSPWLPGNYRVDIYTNNSASPSYSVLFSVEE